MKHPKLTVFSPKLFLSLTLITCLFPSQAALAQTLQPSADGRSIQWSDGTPIFFLSDTAWLLPARYPLSEVVSHAATRKSQGFTAMQMTVCFPEVQNGASLQPIDTVFAGGDMAHPIESYFASVDAKVKAITDAGLIAIINPFWKKGSDSILSSNGTDKCRAYAKFLATRYRSNRYVAWFIGGDDRPEPVRAQMEAMGLGIEDAYREAGLPKAIIAYHGDPVQSSREAFPENPSWLTLDWTYAYSAPLGRTTITPVQENWVSWPKTPAKPIMHGEGWYDRDNGATTGSRWANRYMMRRQIWWSLLSGAIAGQAYGAEPIWTHLYAGRTAAEALTWDSGLDAARVKKFLDTVEWWKLQPDINHTFFTDPNSGVESLDQAVASLASDNSFGIAYTPVARNMTFRVPTGVSYTLRWYDPSNGTYHVDTTSVDSGGTVTLPHPGNNASGSADWVVHIMRSGSSSSSSSKALDVKE